MKYIFFVLLNILAGCYVPEKTVYEFRYVKLISIHKTESGYDLFWKDNIRVYYHPVKDTSGSGLFIGASVLTLLPK